MFKRRSKLLLGALGLALTAGLLGGCGGAKSGSEATHSSSDADVVDGKVVYPLKGEHKLTIAMLEEAAITANAKDLADTPFGKEWQKRTGVTLEIQQYSDVEAMNMMFASGELPDLIFYQFDKYVGGPSKAIKDRIIEPLNDYMNADAPDLKKIIDSDEIYKKSISSQDGQIVGFPFIREDNMLKTSTGFIIRQDWLDDLNLKQPQTPDELKEVLTAFKEKKSAKVPFSTSMLSYAVQNGLFSTPYGLPRTDIYQDGGKVHYGAAEENYKEVLEYLHELFEEGLLDPNFSTVDDNTQNANIMNGDSGLTVGYAGASIGNFLQTMEKTVPSFNVTGFSPLVKTDGDKAMSSTTYVPPVTGTMIAITTACKDKELAAKFLNYGYTEEGHNLFNFGIEGESYKMENGIPTYTDLIKKNPDGLTMQFALAQYTRASSSGPFVQDVEYVKQYSSRPQQQEAIKNWMNADTEKYQMPLVTIPEDKVAEYSKVNGDISTYVSEMFVKYISGLESLDTFDSKYLPTLKDLGVDKMVEIQQEALDEFNNR